MDRGGDRRFGFGKEEREGGLPVCKDESQALGTEGDEPLADLRAAESLGSAEPAGVDGWR
jgi:hypothetical protein